MIRYRYNLTVDSEPGPQVRRLYTWHPDYPGERTVWTRRPCRGRGYRIEWRRMSRTDRRWARRKGVFWVSAGGRRLHHTGFRHRRGAWTCVRATGGSGHYHWTDGDKSRAWGPLRGDILAADADAFRRLHSAKPRKWRRWR
jgi:hypothetical protein